MENLNENSKPIIILENYLSPAAKKFLIENLPQLTKENYKTFLLEMNQEVSLEDFQEQLELALKLTKDDDPGKISIKLLLELFIKLQELKFDIKFIDPERQDVALSFNLAIMNDKSTKAEIKKIIALRELATQKRDKEMAERITSEARTHNNKIIFLGGYAHKNLVKLLTPNNYNFLLATDSNFNSIAPRCSDKSSLWSKLRDVDFRNNFYFGTNVNLVDTFKGSQAQNFKLFGSQSNPEQLYQAGITKFKNKEFKAAIDILLNCSFKFKNEPEKQAMCYSSIASCYRDWGIKEQEIIYLNNASENINFAEKILADNSPRIANLEEKIVKLKDKKLTIQRAILDLQNINQPALQPSK
jgi:hypothetical protein